MTATDGKLLRLDELVSAVRMEEEPQSYYRINGLNSVYLSITAEETANQLQLNRAVMDEMEAVRQVLPVGYEVHTSYDATEYIREELVQDLLPYRFDGTHPACIRMAHYS